MYSCRQTTKICDIAKSRQQIEYLYVAWTTRGLLVKESCILPRRCRFSDKLDGLIFTWEWSSLFTDDARKRLCNSSSTWVRKQGAGRGKGNIVQKNTHTHNDDSSSSSTVEELVNKICSFGKKIKKKWKVIYQHSRKQVYTNVYNISAYDYNREKHEWMILTTITVMSLWHAEIQFFVIEQTDHTKKTSYKWGQRQNEFLWTRISDGLYLVEQSAVLTTQSNVKE